MNIENLEEAAIIYSKIETLDRAEKSIHEMLDENNCREGSFTLMDGGSHIELYLSGAVSRKEMFDAMMAVITEKRDGLCERIIEL